MNLTLHLTRDCNLDCSYCPDEKCGVSMTEETALAACRLAFSEGGRVGLCFFGGEPLLEKELIFRCFDMCGELSEKTGKKADFRMTTNGTLLDDETVQRFEKEKAMIGLSFDGTAQDICRRYKSGGGTADILEEKARLLLDRLPGSYAMMTIAPAAVGKYAESVRYLYGLGFRRITAAIAYGGKVRWTEDDLTALKGQLQETAEFFAEVFSKGEHFYFSPFSSKITECISGNNPAEKCHLGKRQFSVAVDGNIYPCTQFIGDRDWLIGNVHDGIDKGKLREIASRCISPEECSGCGLRARCINSCGCMNRLETGDENKVSPVQCAYERMLIEMSDALAERLIAADEKHFMKEFAK